MKTLSWRVPLALVLAMFIGACAATGPRVTEIPAAAKPVDAPYKNVLVVSLFETPAIRKRFEREMVNQFLASGVEATAMTSLRSTGEPLNRDAVLRQVERIDADAVLVTQLNSLDSSAKDKKQAPQASYTFRSTRYFDVYSVEQNVYDKPLSMEVIYDLALRTDLYSSSSQQIVWSIASERHIKHDVEDQWDNSNIADEAQMIVGRLAGKGLID